MTWTYDVTNPGNVPLKNVVVTDDNGTPGNPADDFHPTFTGGDTNANGLLDPGETWTYTASATATAGQYENFATVTGTGGDQPVTDNNPDHYFGQTSGCPVAPSPFGLGAAGTYTVLGLQRVRTS